MRPFACACVVLVASGAFGQVEAVDPDVAEPKSPLELVDPSVAEAPADEALEDLAPLKRPAAGPLDAGAEGEQAPVEEAPPPAEPSAAPAPPGIVSRVVTDAALDQAWNQWRAANQKAASDFAAEKSARERLLTLRDEIGASNLDTWAVGLLRAAAVQEARGDSGGAVELALSATQLAPELPVAWASLARIYFAADPSEVGRCVTALKNALVGLWSDPRYARPALADLFTTLLLALAITAVAVMLVLAGRRGFYALYDFHFIFPKAASRWQTGALAVVLLLLPVVFGLGLVPALLTIFFALTLYLTQQERVVMAVLIGALGLVPTLASVVVDRLGFAGTRAESMYLLERGGAGLEPFAAELTRLANEDKASYAELMVLGRYELRRGRVQSAVKSFQKALAVRAADPRARINLGVALVVAGDLETPRALFEEAGKVATDLPQAPYNLARLAQRRVAVLGAAAAGETERAENLLYDTYAIAPGFRALSKDDRGSPRSMLANVYLQTVPVPPEEYLGQARAPDAARRVKSQVLQFLTGDVDETLALLYPALLAGLVLALGSLAPTLQAAKVCNRCGRPVSRRGDPELSIGSLLCTQCVNVFARKNVVAPALKVRKLLEVARYQNRLQRVGSVLSFVFSGLGHVFAGFPARGALYAYLFTATLTGAVLRNGVLRPPFEALPLLVRLVPLGVLLVLVYVLALRGLRKRQGAG
ncbi:MAG: hypothetical protein INH41_24045 [Myxococcaceae bacterium]|jgi:tetratricopeptide (TPR) repeat protein|nr:hypothetical protein [Myxococcaceae bacterium]MCA3015473.1 hypothetical protein [Myxococcaceae bacterium]